MILRWYDRTITALVFVAFSVMLGAAFAGTVSRYLTWLPSVSWGEEVTRFAGIWAVFLVSGYSLRHGAHLGVDILTQHLPPKWERRTAFVVYGLILAFAMLLFLYGLRISFENMSQYSAALQWPMGLVYLCLPIGGALMALEIVGVMIRAWSGRPGYLPSTLEDME